MSIEQTRKGSFQIRYTDKMGKRHTYKTVEEFQSAVIGGKTRTGRKLAEALEAQLKQKLLNEDLGIVDTQAPINPLYENYVRNCAIAGLSPNTMVTKEFCIPRFLSQAQIATLADLATEKIIAWRDAMIEENLSVGSIITRLSHVQAFLTWLVVNKHLQ